MRKNVAHQLLIPGRYASFTLGETDAVRRGGLLLEGVACRRCHTVGGRGNRFATSLDGLWERREVSYVLRAIRVPAPGMPDFRLTEGELVELVNAIFAASLGKKRGGSEPPTAVHFGGPAKKRQDVFSRNCGLCHRALTAGRGLLGTGEIGPNLSGLFSPYYPADFQGDRRWTPQRLANWLNNPRRVKENTVMQPVRLNDGEVRELLETLGSR